MLKSLGNVLVIGGIALDMTGTIKHQTKLASILHTSSPGSMRQTLGGVGRNVCEAMTRAGAQGYLVSATGDDLAGRAVHQGLKEIGMSDKYIQTVPQHTTAVYNALHSADGQLVAAIADMDIFEHLDIEKITAILRAEKPGIVCLDGNITPQAIASITAVCSEIHVPVFFEPTSVPKSLKIFEDAGAALKHRSLQFVSPNQYELQVMSEVAKTILMQPKSAASGIRSYNLEKAPRSAHEAIPHGLHLSNWVPNVITKLGQDGCVYIGRPQESGIPPVVQYVSPEPVDTANIKSVTGAGDSFVGALLANLQQRPDVSPTDTDIWREMIIRAQRAAVLTIQSDLAVSPEISRAALLMPEQSK
ncbi:Ribokinase-like protein [Dichotomocladium elegans]|nr:Ribokinase-like protein [Dichotomocladium elegans]